MMFGLKKPKPEEDVLNVKSDEEIERKRIKNKIKSIVGGQELKNMYREIIQIAPQIIKNNTIKSFLSQSYLISINDGYGLTNYLHILSELIDALKLKKILTSEPVVEAKIQPYISELVDSFEAAKNAFLNGTKGYVQVICIDISDWMDNINHVLFRNFLQFVEEHRDDAIVVFRIPFVDKEVLAKIRYHLNDTMYIRPISFEPLTNEEIQTYANDQIMNYGFEMEPDAWPYFHQRMTEEKSNGKFYGLASIQKVTRELLYKKQLYNVLNDRTDLIIEAVNTMELCGEFKDNSLSGMEMLNGLVAGDKIKEQIEEIVAMIELAKKTNVDKKNMPSIHMRFVGNPGTGKTTVARIVGKLLKEKGILRTGNFYEYHGRDFCGRYIGETAPKVASMCRDAYGSVLFIDEAYSLYRGNDSSNDFGREALDALISEMENHRDDLLVIMAGYTDDMETLMRGNAGLRSRMPYCIEFPNFTNQQLFEIFKQMVKKQFKYEEGLFEAAEQYFMGLSAAVTSEKEFSNARFVRNLFERTWAKASMRSQLDKCDEIILTKEDFERSTADKEFKRMFDKKEKYGFL